MFAVRVASLSITRMHGVSTVPRISPGYIFEILLGFMKTFTCSKSTIETIEKDVKYIRSKQ